MFKKILTLGALFIGLWLILGNSRTQAHGYIVRSIPADRAVLQRPPNQVQIWFSEGLEPRFSSISVVNQRGENVDLGGGGVDERNSAKLVVSLPSSLPPGAYLVKMRPVFTGDGHAVNDTLVFWIGQPLGSIDAGGASDRAATAEAVWRTLLQLALTVFSGTLLMYGVVLRPSWGNPQMHLGQLPPRLMQRLSLLLWGSLGVAFITNIAALLQITLNLFQADLATTMRDELWNVTLEGTTFGSVWQYRMGLLIAMLFIQMAAAQQARNRPSSTHVLWLVNGVLSLLALGTISLISHASGASFWREITVLMDYLHVLGVSAWVGGLVVIGVVLRSALAPLDPNGRGQALLVMLRRFSALALASVSLIIVTGIYSTTTRLNTPTEVTTSTYGLTLLAKWLLMLPLLALGAVHYVAVSPQRMAKIAHFIQAQGRWLAIPNTLRLEMGLAVAVLCVAAWLPATPPPAPESNNTELISPQQTLTVEGYKVDLTITPSTVGANSYDVKIFRQDGVPALLDGVRLRFYYPDYGRYSPWLPLEASELGLWIGASGDLDQAATWHVWIDLYPANGLPVRATFEWEVIEELPPTRYATWVQWGSLLLVGAVILGWGLPWLRSLNRHLDWSAENLAFASIGVGLTLLIIVGGAFYFEQNSQRIQERRNPRPEYVNPLFGDQASLMQGRVLYQQECESCHKPDSSGTLAENLNISTRSDSDLFRLLTRNLTKRHPYDNTTLTETEAHLIILFLRSF